MTQTLRARFDGRALIPEEPVDLPQDVVLDITIEGMDRPAESTRLPTLADPNKSLEEKLAAIRRTFSHGVEGANIPAEALRRENMYGDDER